MWLFLILLGLGVITAGIYGFKKGWFRGMNPPLIRKVCIGGGILLIVGGILMTSVINVPTKHTAHLTKKFGVELRGDRVIAINGERGRQADMLQEGWLFSPFIEILYDIDYVPYEVISEGQVGLLKAVDGA